MTGEHWPNHLLKYQAPSEILRGLWRDQTTFTNARAYAIKECEAACRFDWEADAKERRAARDARDEAESIAAAATKLAGFLRRYPRAGNDIMAAAMHSAGLSLRQLDGQLDDRKIEEKGRALVQGLADRLENVRDFLPPVFMARCRMGPFLYPDGISGRGAEPDRATLLTVYLTDCFKKLSGAPTSWQAGELLARGKIGDPCWDAAAAFACAAFGDELDGVVERAKQWLKRNAGVQVLDFS